MCENDRMTTSDRAEDYNFLATIRTPHETVKRVLCRLWLPRRVTGEIRMVFYPTQRQAEHHFGQLNPFSVYGRILGFPGNATTISASEVWVNSIPTRSLSGKRRETVFEADPVDLQVFTTARPDDTKGGKQRTHIDYILTPSPRELTPSTIRTIYASGAVRVRTVRQFSITLRNQRGLKFVKRHHHEEGDEGELTWADLRASEERVTTRRLFAQVDQKALDDLDDFLTLTTFSSRFVAVCVGIDSYSENGDRFLFYRKDRTAPRAVEQDTNNSVIDLSNFKPFIRKAYRWFARSGDSGPHELLRHALHLLTPRVDRTVESEFTTLFAALETIVLWHRRRADLEWIVEDVEQWVALRKDIGDFLKQHDLLKNDKESRKLMRAKLGELRRVPFSTAFESLCMTYAVNLSDLWPVLGRSGEMPLSEIRNHIVHGSTLSWGQFLALGHARHHLRWTVERILLAVIGWPVAESKVRPDWLARNRTAMIELESSRRAMRGLPLLQRGSTEGT